MKIRLAVVFVALGLSACAGGEKEENLVLARQPLKAPNATLQTGEDCTTYGKSGCLSGVCLHAVPNPLTGYFCTAACSVVAECPEAWTCGRIPGTYTSYCIPPAGWVGKVTTAREARGSRGGGQP